MTVSFSYGKRDGALVYVGDLRQELERGRACDCCCPECARPLQAHLGNRKAWHFQHLARDLNCSPQPMTLLHAFVRDELAKRESLTIPGVLVPVEFDEVGRSWSRAVEIPAVTFSVVRAATELRVEDLQPDVVFDIDDNLRLAVEVRYSHGVDPEKQQKLHRHFSFAAELDVSDLPASGIGKADLERILREPQRWRWLVNGKVLFERGRLQEDIRWRHSNWKLKEPPHSAVLAQVPPTQKLKRAAGRLGWAKGQLQAIREKGVSSQAGAVWLGLQDKIDRVAIACAALGLEPTALPSIFQQQIQGKNVRAISHHAYSWQVVIFMKFGVGNKWFSAHDAAAWAAIAMPDRVDSDNLARSLNGFTRTAALLQTYFLDLVAQGFLKSNSATPLEARIFQPVFLKPAELRKALQGRPA